MKLKELLSHLEQGELRQMALGGSDTSGFLERDLHKIVPHINLGLTAVHKRFLLRTKTVFVQQYDEISIYELNSKFAETNTASSEPVKYIKDSVFDPFITDMVLKIEGVFDEDGRKYWLNNANEPMSLFTPSDRSIQVPFPDSENVMSVMYRADHPRIQVDVDDPLEQEIDISSTYLESLLLYIGSRYLKTQGTPEAAVAGANTTVEYEGSVRQVKQDGLDISEDTTNFKLDDNGWI